MIALAVSGEIFKFTACGIHLLSHFKKRVGVFREHHSFGHAGNNIFPQTAPIGRLLILGDGAFPIDKTLLFLIV